MSKCWPSVFVQNIQIAASSYPVSSFSNDGICCNIPGTCTSVGN
ncbi:hypothetical protein NC653_035472 [Populus alba x Populus x berolinensis]|uniref:Uncharacterized protein n=1 Tax=Populus alba x Populus x berolinensis TaxID=444605 RepID=A0AAD6LT29_9ROSI|nr:hypothetical protein NC653_035472 [Populus alba x Populus x berolinensis]